MRSVSVFHALFMRDVRNVVREPAFFANGPLFVFLFPVIFVLSFSIGFVASGQSLVELLSDLQMSILEIPAEKFASIKYYVTLGGAAFTVFSGTFSNLATTSFSREGKSLNDLKAMPLKFDMIVKVKFWHAMLYVGFGGNYFYCFAFCSLFTVSSAYHTYRVYSDVSCDGSGGRLCITAFDFHRYVY